MSTPPGSKLILSLSAAGAALLLPACDGIMSGIYDVPKEEVMSTVSGQLYIDASDWQEWHYIDLCDVRDSIAANPSFNPSSLWQTFEVPEADGEERPRPDGRESGVYTYWYDVFGQGISRREFRSFAPAPSQPEPERWSFAVHRNNVRTNGGAVAATPFFSLDDIPGGDQYLSSLVFAGDEWNETDVWTVQERMLSGAVGNQGIYVNNTLSAWLTMEIPPMPPIYSRSGRVYILRMADGTYAALQLANHVAPDGTNCCLTINYRYPL